MSDGRRQLSFSSEDEVIAEIDRLRASGYSQRGNWSLPQICFHLASGGGSARPPASPTPTPQQAAAKKNFIDLILTTGKPPPGFEAPPEMTPGADCGDDDIQRFRDQLCALRDYSHDLVDFGPFGPVATAQVRALTLAHAAHHLSHLDPKATRREGLAYRNEDDVIADVQRLRRGYLQAGAWSLPQMCHHLEKAVHYRMQPGPFPPTTPEQEAKRPLFQQVMASGRLPDAIPAPEPMVPPTDCGEADIDALIRALGEFKSFPGPIAPHRIFGHLPDPDARRLNLIHCAHHLSYLVPTST